MIPGADFLLCIRWTRIDGAAVLIGLVVTILALPTSLMMSVVNSTCCSSKLFLAATVLDIVIAVDVALSAVTGIYYIGHCQYTSCEPQVRSSSGEQ